MTETERRGMEELIRKLNDASYAYYVLDNPFISDMQWDRMYDELKKLEAETGVVLENSPTRKVGGDPLKGFTEHRHITRLWSMDKVQSFEELDAWIARTEKLAGKTGLQYYAEYKFDGLTLNLTYDGGKLVQAATRGNGITGEAILPQAKTIHSVPQTIPYPGLIEVQGECIMRLSTLEKYNKTAKEPLKNARNAAAGALRNLDPAVTASRHLDAFFYQVGTIENPPYHSQPGMLDFLRENGFQVSPFLGSATGREGIEKCIREIGAQRKSLDWLIDGVVIKVGDYALREQMGYTEKFPRWAVAYKFEAEECVTTLRNVTWELGRTGKLTPLAHLDPVDFYGVTVRRATLNNMGDILRKNVAIGCDVWIRRSNDVIPEITGRAGEPKENETEIVPPPVCPACGAPLTERGAHLYCMNRTSCRPQAVARIAHFAGREAMDIDGLSEKTAELLYDRCGVREAADLYRLTPMDLLMLDGFQQKKAANLIDALEKSKHCELDAFLFALGIPNVGRKTARDLAQAFGTLDKLSAATAEQLTALPDIGETVASSITEYFSFPENLAMIRSLLDAGVHPSEMEHGGEGVFSGLSIVVTGTLPNLSRRQAEDLIRSRGGNAASSVSKKTAFVVVGEDAGSKLAKATALGIETIDEAELIRRAGAPTGV
ncbi:MAG: NAD-dependent DNA ligase LigA [Clostridiales bacterium]|nr:NAD-dependent DNA ligase LigA [Clostridiales bacterium]